MEQILNNVTSLAWWFGVVFVGLLVSLLASYIKPRLDNWLASFSESLRKRNKVIAEQWDQEVQKIRGNETYRLTKFAQLSYLYGKATFIVAMGIAAFLMASTFPTLLEIPMHVDPDNTRASLDVIQAVGSSKWFILFRLIIYLSGAVSFLLGMAFFSQAEKVSRQIKEGMAGRGDR